MPRDIETDPLTEQELLDLVATHPKLVTHIQDQSPQAKLHTLLYTDKLKFGDKTYREVIEEMGVNVAPDSALARTRRHVREEITPVLKENERLAKELRERDARDKESVWRRSVKAAANEYDAEVSDEEVDEIATFMTDNGYGPTAAATKSAVSAWLESKAPAEPGFEPTLALPTGEDEHSKELAKLGHGDDLGPNTARGVRHAEKVWHEMFGKNTRFKSPAFTTA